MVLGLNQLSIIAVSIILGLVVGWFIHHLMQRGPIAELENRVRQEEAKLQRSNRELQASRLEANRLRSESARAEKDREKLNRLQKVLKETRLEKEVLEIRLADRTRSLQRRDRRQASAPSSGTEIPLKDSSTEVTSPSQPDSGATETTGNSAPLYSEKPEDSDDLKRIKGIGNAIESKLNNLGIYNFEQIAHFSDESIAWVAQKIGSFPDRIDRDRWVEQAQTFLSKAR